MKKILTLCFTVIYTVLFAQDKIFVHTSTSENISESVTFIDNPLINNNPEANLLITERYIPGGVAINKITGVFYENTSGR